jgi:hypothetical protein
MRDAAFTSLYPQLWARTLILSYTWQAVVSVIIAINFAINLAQSSAMPESGSGTAEFFFALDAIFTAVRCHHRQSPARIAATAAAP